MQLLAHTFVVYGIVFREYDVSSMKNIYGVSPTVKVYFV